MTFIFFLMILLPPRSTLFPYTTLFRSCSSTTVQLRLRPPLGPLHRPFPGPANAVALGVGHARAEDALRLPLRIEDRKSTRLNSSHGYISYAVFCLKKKTSNTKN